MYVGEGHRVFVVADSAPPRRIIYFFEKWNGEITVVIKWSRWRFLLLPACSWSNSNLTAFNSLFTHIKTRRVLEAYLGQQTREKKKSMNNKLNIFKEYNSSVNTTRLHFWATIILYWAITNTTTPAGDFCLLHWFVDAIFLHDSVLIVSLTKRQQQQKGEMKIICRKNTHC